MSTPDRIRLRKEWKLGGRIGCGGFASVFEAEADGEPPSVAKLIPKEPGADRELLFSDQDMKGVPNIIPVVDRGDAGHYWAIVMRRADHSLAEVLDSLGRPLTPDEAIPILIDIADALVGLQGRVVHRDLKPHNVLLYQGHWCLADFGIARYAAASTDPNTRKFALTPPYAAPEQWRMDRATPATDVYAFGVMSYQMLSGALPFPGPRDDFRDQHLHREPPSLPSGPDWLRSLVSECLMKAPEARPTAANIRARLQRGNRPASDAQQELQKANQKAVAERAQESADMSAAQSESERRRQLLDAAKRTLQPILDRLVQVMGDDAPESVGTATPAFPFRLRGAELNRGTVHGGIKASLQWGDYDPPFDLIAYTRLTLTIPRNRWGYEGRSHSLWYCDAQEEGVYRWFETAFMIHPMIPRSSAVDPFALDPGDDAAGALSPAMDTNQVAWPFTPIDQGDEDELIERWIAWFADAAQGNLLHPSRMPERDTSNSWRQPKPRRR
ncbi:MAG: serine/threonine-protein kinase [Dehalococcoidia bacterium]